ncbi:hypothetical protein L218DRAFT_845141, partial [Marasmius fiardii PR-910]
PWHTREIFQLGLALFHLIMNLIWGLLHHHRGSVREPGSLFYFFSLLDKRRLGNDKPDYHTLLVALTHGIILNDWSQKCGYTSLTVFAQSKPSVARLKALATSIVDFYLQP